MEKLAPVQAVLKSDNKEQAFEMCEAMLKHGAGHTAAIHTNDQALVREYGQRMHACRIIWNSRAPSAAWATSTTPSPRP